MNDVPAFVVGSRRGLGRAIVTGSTTFTGAAGAFENRVILDHGGGVGSIYGHVAASFPVKKGQATPAGTVVATVGGTGVGSGCHLDLKIRFDGDHTDSEDPAAASGVNPHAFDRSGSKHQPQW